MADNILVDPGTGGSAKPVATDDVSGVQYQVIKIATGADGVANYLSSANPLPIGPLVAGGVAVVSGGYEYQAVAAAQTGTVLQVSAGATGDYLESILCVVTTAATSQVMIGDGAAPSIVILPNNVGAGVGSYPVPLGLTSKTGSWRVTTAAGVSILATGNFS